MRETAPNKRNKVITLRTNNDTKSSRKKMFRKVIRKKMSVVEKIKKIKSV